MKQLAEVIGVKYSRLASWINGYADFPPELEKMAWDFLRGKGNYAKR
ncbi:MAG: hypothetical protein ABIA63_06030 [bacterium]